MYESLYIMQSYFFVKQDTNVNINLFNHCTTKKRDLTSIKKDI